MIPTLLIVVPSVFVGGVIMLVALVVIERMVLTRPGGKRAVAKRLLDDASMQAQNDAWRVWCDTHPGSVADDDSYLDIHQWSAR